MARSSSTSSLPIPRGAIRKLERRLGISLKGWDACPPQHVSPAPGDGVDGARFDVEAVARVVEVLRLLPHTQGEWARQPFEAAPWQIVWVLAPVFGWKNADGTRVVRELWEEVPRKNGKTSLSARLGVIGMAADGEEGAQVYAAAHNEKQARLVFDEAATVVRRSPALGPKARSGAIRVGVNVIHVPKTTSIFRVLSRDAEAAHGLNVHFGIVDEIHVHKSRRLIDAIATGTGARRQPLMIYITTADEGDEGTIYAEKHSYAVRLAEGSVVDPTTYAVIWAADRDDDPFDEKTWRKANPNYPVSPNKRYLEREALRAEASPSLLPTFLRLHLNVRAVEEGRRVDWDWVASAGMVVEDKLHGAPCWGGLVTRSAQDLTALCWTFRSPEVEDEWWVLWRHFLPAERLPSLNERTDNNADAWVRAGVLKVTEGDVIDIAAHLAVIRADAARFQVQEMAFDPNGAIGIVSPLTEEDRFAMVPVYANTPSSSFVDWEGLVRSERYRHGANPVMTWQMSNLVLRDSAGGVTKIDPKASRDVVPGAIAAEMALRRALLAEQPKVSAYDERGLLIV